MAFLLNFNLWFEEELFLVVLCFVVDWKIIVLFLYLWNEMLLGAINSAILQDGFCKNLPFYFCHVPPFAYFIYFFGRASAFITAFLLHCFWYFFFTILFEFGRMINHFHFEFANPIPELAFNDFLHILNISEVVWLSQAWESFRNLCDDLVDWFFFAVNLWLLHLVTIFNIVAKTNEKMLIGKQSFNQLLIDFHHLVIIYKMRTIKLDAHSVDNTN